MRDKAWAVGETFSVMARYFPLSELPAFAQVNGGYSSMGKPLCQPLSGLGPAGLGAIQCDRPGALCHSDQSRPGFQIEPGGLRLELGVGWNL